MVQKQFLVRPPEAWKEVAGICVGKCFGTNRKQRALGHAHNHSDSKDFGWVCIKSWKGVGEVVACDDFLFEFELVKPNSTAWHEYAHILAQDTGHGKLWKQKMRGLGRSVPKRYSEKKVNWAKLPPGSYSIRANA